ncbi:DUF6194 family protein [Nocardia sp. NPDC058058]|uniref:DUF6194 family protein n=1 Tax=Nocardia sp. NPDC058058 TaxID=3346317 RepID=UPI0036D81712
MTIEEIIALLDSLPGTLRLSPTPGDPTYPEIAWGDSFIYYAPDGKIPTTVQPFTTVVTKDYPDDKSSNLNRPNTFRLNIHAGKDSFTTHLGYPPRDSSAHPADPSALDTLIPHPTYASAGWLSIVNPGPQSEPVIADLLHTAYDRARTRYNRNSPE